MGSDDPTTGEISRRTALKTTSTVVALGGIQTVSAKPENEDEWSHLGKKVFGEVGFKVSSEELESNSHIDQVSPYYVDSSSGEVRYYILPKDIKDQISGVSSFISHRKPQPLPKIINNGRKSRMIPYSLNSKLDRVEISVIESDFQFPAIRIRNKKSNSIQLSHKDQKKSIKPGEKKSMEIDINENQIPEGYSDFNPKVTLRNNGELDVYVNKVMEE